MNRKEFLKNTLTIASGTLILPPFVLSKPIFEHSLLTIDLRDSPVFWSLLGRFAFAVGAGVATELVMDYIRKRSSNRDLRTAVTLSNERMRENGGFTDLSKSHVYKMPKGEIMYAAINPNDGNICAPLINQRKYSNAPLTMLEGPSLSALVPVAERNFRNKQLANDYLVPIHEISPGYGSFEEGLSTPTVYVSRKGNVKVSYDSNGNGKGKAYVSVTDKNRNRVISQPVDIIYRT